MASRKASNMTLVEAYSQAIDRWTRLKNELRQTKVDLDSAESIRFSTPSASVNEQCQKAKGKIADLERQLQMAQWDVEFLIHRNDSFADMGHWPRA